MTLSDETKAYIDALTYESLLASCRVAPSGDPRWCGEEGRYRMDRMRALREAGADHVGASKRIGWDRA